MRRFLGPSGGWLNRSYRDGGRRLLSFQLLEVEVGYIGAAGKFNADGWFPFRFNVILRELLAQFGGFDAHYRVVSRVVTDRSPEHLGSDHPLAQLVEVLGKSVSYDQLEKILGSFTTGKDVAG